MITREALSLHHMYNVSETHPHQAASLAQLTRRREARVCISLDACTAHQPSQVAAACVMMAFDYFAQPWPSPTSLAGLHVHSVAAAAADVSAAVHFVHGELREHNIPPGIAYRPLPLPPPLALSLRSTPHHTGEEAKKSEGETLSRGGLRRAPWGAQQVRGSRTCTEAVCAQAARQPVRWRTALLSSNTKMHCWVLC